MGIFFWSGLEYFYHMSSFHKIKSYVNRIEKEAKFLDFNQTMKMLEAVKEISQNRALIDKVMCLILIIENENNHIKKLTKREEQIFNLIGCGFTSAEIAAILSISAATVATHRKNTIKKLKLNGSGQLRSMAYRYTQKKGTLNQL